MTAWRIEADGGETFSVATAGGGPVSRSAFAAALAEEPALRAALTEVLRASPCTGCTSGSTTGRSTTATARTPIRALDGRGASA
jgi:hypothetical protein